MDSKKRMVEKTLWLKGSKNPLNLEKNYSMQAADIPL